MDYQSALNELQTSLPGELINRVENLYDDLDYESDPFVSRFVEMALTVEQEDIAEPGLFFEEQFKDSVEQEQLQAWWESDWKRRGYKDEHHNPSFLQKSVHEEKREADRIVQGEVSFEEQIKRGMKEEFFTILSEIKEYADENMVTNTETNER